MADKEERRMRRLESRRLENPHFCTNGGRKDSGLKMGRDDDPADHHVDDEAVMLAFDDDGQPLDKLVL